MSKGRIIIYTSIMIVLMASVIFAVSYAYFLPRISNVGGGFSLTAGKVSLSITNSNASLTGGSLKPLRDSEVLTKGTANRVTVSKSVDSNLDTCYSLDLIIDSIDSEIRSPYVKYKIVRVDDNTQTVSGSFATTNTDIVDNGDNTYTLNLFTNQYMSTSVTSLSYDVYVYFLYDDDTSNNQVTLFNSLTNKGFTGHYKATGRTGACS